MKLLFPRVKHLSTRITLCFVILILIVFISMAVLTVSLYSEQLSDEMNSVLLRKLSLINVTISKALEQVQSMHFSISSNPAIIEILRQSQMEESLDDDTIAQLNNAISLYTDNAPYIRSAFIIDCQNRILQPFFAFYTDQVINTNAYQLLIQSAKTRTISEPNHFPLVNSTENSAITYYGKIYDNHNNYRTLGTIALNLKWNLLFSEVGALTTDAFSLCMVINEDNRLIAKFGSDTDNAALIDAALQGNTKGYRTYETTLNAYHNWRILCIQSEAIFANRLTTLTNMVLVLSGTLILLVVMMSFTLSNMITRPIQNICTAMSQLGVVTKTQQWPKPIVTETRDEIHDLIKGFNDMAYNLQYLTAENLARQEREKRMEIENIKMELDMLQLQINPHFIHNTLNTMHYLALEGENKDLADMISSFNMLLRNNFAQNGSQITTLEEIGNLNNYLFLQKKRYSFPIHFRYDVHPDLNFALIPKLLVQPLVENALFHGIIPAQGGTITVHFQKEDEYMKVSVADDGVGMTSEALTLLERGQFQSPKSYNAFGMKNVNERLELLYGSNCKLHIESIVGKGTLIQFMVPIELKF